MEYDNEMQLIFSGKSENESFARMSVSAFAAQLDPTVSDLTDIKTAVSEAVTNAIIHGYGENSSENVGQVYVHCGLKDKTIYIEVRDEGIGIENVQEAMTPLYTSKPDMERSGMGFTVMETFMDCVNVSSVKGEGTTICMTKKIDVS